MMDNYLQHYGILGMKWGVRRFQNPDGSYTSLGKKRRNSGIEIHPDYARAHDGRKVSQMSDRELREITNRLQTEKQYKELTKKRSIGMTFVKSFVKGAGTLGSVVAAYGIYKKNGAIIAAGILSKLPNDVVEAYKWYSDKTPFGGWAAE